MGAPDRSDVAEVPVDGDAVDHAVQEYQAKGGRLRRLLTGAVDDEFTENVRPLSSAQREHLTRATDVLMKRYSISRTADPLGPDDSVEGEPLSADELGAVLQTVLAEVFDFGWFTRPDLSWAPELDFESSSDPSDPTAQLEAIRAEQPLAPSEPAADLRVVKFPVPVVLRVVDLSAEPEIALFESELDPDVIEDLEADDFDIEDPDIEDPEDEGSVVEAPAVEGRVVEAPAVEGWVVEGRVDEGRVDGARVAAERVAAERMAAELETMLVAAVAAEREAILFASATRDRLQSARAVVAALDAQTGLDAENFATTTDHHDDRH